MATQYGDLEYGYGRETANHPTIEKHLGVKIAKLDKYHTMDWREIQKPDDSTSSWLIEQKARKCSYKFLGETYSYNGKATALIGKNKIDYMKCHGETGIVYFDFTDKLMYWVFDADEYATFDIEEKFKRGARADCIDKCHPVVHIPCSILKEVVLPPPSPKATSEK